MQIKNSNTWQKVTTYNDVVVDWGWIFLVPSSTSSSRMNQLRLLVTNGGSSRGRESTEKRNSIAAKFTMGIFYIPYHHIKLLILLCLPSFISPHYWMHCIDSSVFFYVMETIHHFISAQQLTFFLLFCDKIVTLHSMCSFSLSLSFFKP